MHSVRNHHLWTIRHLRWVNPPIQVSLCPNSVAQTNILWPAFLGSLCEEAQRAQFLSQLLTVWLQLAGTGPGSVNVNRAVFWFACPICPVSRFSRMEKSSGDIFGHRDPGRGSIQRWRHLVTGWAFCPDVWPCVKPCCTQGLLRDGNGGYSWILRGQTRT